MPTGNGPAVGIPPATNDVFATWKILTRENGVLVKYSSPAPPPPWLLKMASPMWLPPGSARVMPATTVTVSVRLAASGTPPTCENAQLRATARSQAYPSTTTLCGSVLGGSSAPRLRLNVRTTSVRLPADTSSESNRNVAPARSRTPIHEMALGSVACTRIVSFASTRLVTLWTTEGGVVSFAADSTETVTVP